MPKRPSSETERDKIIAALQDYKFHRAAEFIERHPLLARRSAKKVRLLLERMRRLKLDVPSIVRRRPKVLYTSPARIAAKLAGLRALGFRQPHVLINYHHTILGLSIGTIDAKLAVITDILGSRPAAIVLVEKRPSLLAYSVTRIKLVAHLASADGLRGLIGIPENLLVAASEQASPSHPTAIRAAIAKLKA